MQFQYEGSIEIELNKYFANAVSKVLNEVKFT